MIYLLGLLLAFLAGGALATWIWVLVSHLKPSSAPSAPAAPAAPAPRIETY